jgi:hypothetical protein
MIDSKINLMEILLNLNMIKYQEKKSMKTANFMGNKLNIVTLLLQENKIMIKAYLTDNNLTSMKPDLLKQNNFMKMIC